MKIRNGFVSNSSATSFTLYGWSIYENGWKKDNEKAYEIIQKLEVPEEYKKYILIICAPGDDICFGLGNEEDEIDHGYEDDSWEDYKCEEVPNDVIEWLRKRAKELGLEAPMPISYTWFNG